MIVHYDDAPNPPPCFNAEPIGPVRVDHVLNRQTGKVDRVDIRNDWARPGCHSWAPGIGQPAQEYPSGVPYPIAHGWAAWCKQCRWMPAEVG